MPPLCGADSSKTWARFNSDTPLVCRSAPFTSPPPTRPPGHQPGSSSFSLMCCFVPPPKEAEEERGGLRREARSGAGPFYAPVKPTGVLTNGMQAHNALHSSNRRRRNSFDSVECPAPGALSSSAAATARLHHPASPPPSPPASCRSSPDAIYLEIYAEMCSSQSTS